MKTLLERIQENHPNTPEQRLYEDIEWCIGVPTHKTDWTEAEIARIDEMLALLWSGEVDV